MRNDEEMEDLRKELKMLMSQQVDMAERLSALRKRMDQLEGRKAASAGSHEKIRHKRNGRPASLFSEEVIGLRLLHVAGIVVLVAGVAFGVRYAIDKNLLPDALRVALAYIAAGILVTLGWRLKHYSLFSAILFSGGLAICYFTTYAATAYYSFISVPLAFAAMLAITLAAIYIAIIYQRKEIAQIGMTGAYAIPFLLSSDSGNITLLFSYIAFINAGVAFLAWKMRWGQVLYQAAVITWMIFAGWALFRYSGEWRTSSISYLIYFHLFFLLSFLWSPVVGKSKELRLALEFHLLNQGAFYGCALLLFQGEAAMVTGLVCVWSLLLILFISRFKRLFDSTWLQAQRLYTITLLTLFIYLAASGIFVTVGWLLLAGLVFGGGVWYQATPLRMAGIVLSAVALVKLLIADRYYLSPAERIISYILIGLFLLVISFYYQHYQKKNAGREQE